ncbi:type VI secretion system tip protein TssI/VgrG [Vibrio rhizosphaerae]|uniref:Type VI secretion system tip protein TssI/VgrG n=1 Tax=Vibrio rhizosphaerae TaxID=398736 RepID=A0ABU4INJ8_9VIBR|nr:type VI secretion system tip protein TssI/VgrG [Vibrio rhizosphaerae]MDW6090990.1 type VI secretion system tip protein TssI/VgrG [Vibrio rhizosphaerae]
MTTLGFRFTIDGVHDDTLVVREYQGEESVSDSTSRSEERIYGFRYQIELASRNADLAAKQIVDKTALLEVIQNGEVTQKVHGIVRHFSRGDTGHSHSFYSVTLVPALERLSLRRNSRIFQEKNILDIFKILFQEMNITDYVFSVKRECAPREFCVQYRESDLDFFHRLAAEEGLMYTFTHEKGKHTLVLTDNSEGFTPLGSPVPYNALSGGHMTTPYVSTMTEHYQSEVSSIMMQDYSFKKPDYNFAQSLDGTDLSYQLPDYEYFDHPGRFKDDANGKAFSKIRLEYLRRTTHTASGKSNDARVQGGVCFELEEHIDAAMNREWLAVSVSHQGTQPQALEEAGGHGATTYANQFTVIPKETLWRATPQPKPQVDGPCIATVVGPKGEEIYCDEHGRVKLHFPWDRYDQSDEKSSCWVRVAQGWAGGQYGFMAIPRIGHEVIVSFLNGDPDQPIITGRTYHATNVTPYLLPNHKTRTVLKTQTHQGEGSNEVRFEDQSGVEQIYIHAQKDQDIVINNIHRESVGLDSHRRVGRHLYQMITENVHRLVGKNVNEEFGQDHHVKVGRNVIQRIIGKLSQFISGGIIQKIEGAWVADITASEEKKIGANQRVEVNNESYLKAKKVILDAGDSLTIHGPGGFVKIDSGGVTISGTKVKINEGGSPDKGTAPTMVKPDETNKPQEPEAPDRRG